MTGVSEAVVFGVTDDNPGETAVVALVSETSESEAREALVGGIVLYKQPPPTLSR